MLKNTWYMNMANIKSIQSLATIFLDFNKIIQKPLNKIKLF
jgi:hypothetical protein